ncbi:MAG: CaiB/BaiF CoA-transferase family protein [Imperialibacter sp.]|uniref:CaiB/BaiF CoA transferase family protein n=1 Tax=Imperialibacter sp. TaxID=2038411 RepID=UPI0032EBED57
MQSTAIFSDLKVIELASVLAGPSVGQFFAELGAEVIKIENPETGGDVTRSWKLASEPTDSDMSAYFMSVNAGKKSVLLNLKKREDIEKLYALVKTADIVIASYKPGDAENLRVSYADLKALKPDLIYGHITGFGLDEDRVGYDAIVQAESGFVFLNGEKEGVPQKMPVALTDVLAGHQLKEGLLLALIKRMKSGKGSYVTVSLMEAAISSLVNQATNWLVAGEVPQRLGSEHPNIAPYGNIFKTADEQWLMIAVGSDKQFKALCHILDLNGLSQKPEFNTNAARVKNREMLKPLLIAAFLAHDIDRLCQAFLAADIPYGRVNTMDQVFATPQGKAMVLQTIKNGLAQNGLRQAAFRMGEGIYKEWLSTAPHLGSRSIKKPLAGS